MTTRIKISLPTITTRDEAEATMNDLALAENNRRNLITQRDEAVLLINTRYETSLAAYADSIKEKTETLRAWAEANPDAFPKDRKSIKFLSGTLGFRTGTPKLALLSRAFNWERVLQLVKQYWPGFIRIKEKIDKEGLLAMHSQTENKLASEADLKRCGLKVSHDESFYVDPDLTQFETRQVSAS